MRFSPAVSMLAFLTFATPALAAEDYVMMKVNSQDVSASEVKKFWEGLFPAGQAPAFESMKQDVREKVLRGVMAEKLVYSEALSKGVDKSDAVQKELEELKKKLVMRRFLDAKTSDTISDSDLKKEYETIVSDAKAEREVHARHVLVQSEAEAKDIRKKIDDGKSFEDAARDYSKDAGSAKNGGDLGYFTKDKMVKEFADAAFAMKKGEISAPVKSSFGWHIIKVEDSRKITPPPFAEVKEQLRAKLQEKKLNDYVGGLVKSADVKVFDAKGKEATFDKNLPNPDKAAATPMKLEEKKPAEKAAEKKAEKSEKPVEAVKPAEKPVEKKEAEKKEEKPAEAKSEKAEKSEKTEGAH